MIRRFEDIIAWQRGREFDKIIKLASEVSRLIYYLIESLKVSKIKGAKFK